MNSEELRALPDAFCWTKFGTEASESVERILLRKEGERLANGGVFLWGIGNAIGPSIVELARHIQRPHVFFSPIKSRPRRRDVTPPAVVAWTSATAADGSHFALPPHSLVTSSYDPASPKCCHYALICFTEVPLSDGRLPLTVEFDSLRNLRTGRPLGSSQVTAVVRRGPPTARGGRRYNVALHARLIEPYLVRLTQAVPFETLTAGTDKCRML